MEIFARALNAAGEPVPYATVQRLYPDGQNYGDPIVADGNGNFNGRVPDRNYKWYITSAGYKPAGVSLANAVHDQPANPLIVTMESNYMDLPEVVITPGSGGEGMKQTTMVAWATAAIVVGVIAHDQKWI